MILLALKVALLAVGGLALFFALWMLVPETGLVVVP